MFISDIFPNFKHIIYLDADTVVLDDISKLYEKCNGDYLFAACVDNEYSCYMERVSKITPFQINSWFNSGVMIFNINKCKDINLSKLSNNEIIKIKNNILKTYLKNYTQEHFAKNYINLIDNIHNDL